MPIKIDVTDFKCFNQLRNGELYNRNITEYTPNLVGNVGEEVRLAYDLSIIQFSYADITEEWNLQPLGGLFKEITRTSGSFLDDRVQVGDVFDFYDSWDTYRLITNQSLYTGQVDYISSDGLLLRYSVLSGDDTTLTGVISNVGLLFDQWDASNENTALFLKFGLIGSDETFNYQSKVTESQQVYYAGGLVKNVPKGGQSLGTIKDWVAGDTSILFQSIQPEIGGASYRIVHTFVLNPFYILSYRSFIDNGTVPELFEGDSSIKYAFDAELRKTLTNTGSSKSQTFDNLLGFVGWYGENFNGLNTKYAVKSISYEDDGTGDPLESININTPTKATIVVEDIGGSISGYSCSVHLIRLPDSEDEYIGTDTDMLENFIYKKEIVSSPDTTSANVTTSIVSGDLVIEYTIGYTTAEKLRLTTDDEFMIMVQVEDPAIAVGDSDRTMLIADLRNYVDIDFVQGFVDVSNYTFLQFPQNIIDNAGGANIEASNEDGIILNALIGSDVTRSVVINSIKAALVAYNPIENTSFELDSFEFNIGDLLVSGGVQQIEVESTRGYPLAVGDDFNLVRITTESQVGDFQQYQIFLGQKIKWQDWVLNVGADDVFFDSTKPNNNLNEKSSNYSGKQDYGIRLALIVNVTGDDDLGRSLTGDFIHYGNVIGVNDYDESSDGVTGVIETFDLETGNSLQGGILYNGKDTLFRAVFQNAADMGYAIHRIEPSQSPGDGILELSSEAPPSAGNLLKPVSGETELTFDLVGSELTTECLIDGSAIQEGVNYKLSSRVDVVPPLVVILYTTWNDASAADGAFSLDNPFTGAGAFSWSVEGGNTYNTTDLDIPADTGDLDGTSKKITLLIDGAAITDKEGSMLWGTKKLTGDLDLTGFEGATFTGFDVRQNTDLSSVNIPESTMNGIVRFSESGVVNVDLSLVTINQSTNVSIGFFECTELETITFKTGSIKSNGVFSVEGCTALTSLDLSDFTTFDVTLFQAQGCALLSSFTPPTTWSASSQFDFYSTGLTSLDVSGLTLTGTGNVNIYANSSLTSITFGTTSWNRPSNVLQLHSNNITGTLNTSTCTITVSQWESYGNSLMTSISFNAATKTDRLRSYNCDLGYIDITGIFNDWDNIISINLSDNNMAAAEVNHYLTDMDGEVTAGVYTIDISGSNAAPDGTSGGFDGLSAKTSLISKGLTITSS